MNAFKVILVPLLLTILLGSCDKKNKINTASSGSGGSPANPIYGSTGGVDVNYLLNSVACNNQGFTRSGQNNQRYRSDFHITGGGYNSGILGTMQSGHASGTPSTSYVGYTTIGDLIVVTSLNNNVHNITFYMCEYYPLIYSNRNIIQAAIIQDYYGRGMVLKNRPDCKVNEVTSGVFRVLVPQVNENGSQLNQLAFDLAFARAQNFLPSVCN